MKCVQSACTYILRIYARVSVFNVNFMPFSKDYRKTALRIKKELTEKQSERPREKAMWAKFNGSFTLYYYTHCLRVEFKFCGKLSDNLIEKEDGRAQISYLLQFHFEMMCCDMQNDFASEEKR